MNDYLKIKDDFDITKLTQIGFERNDYSNVEGLAYKGVQYEMYDYYPMEEDGTRYESEYGFTYRSVISIGEKDRLVDIEIINNDCSYHIEGSEVNFVANIIHELTKIGCLERVEK